MAKTVEEIKIHWWDGAGFGPSSIWARGEILAMESGVHGMLSASNIETLVSEREDVEYNRKPNGPWQTKKMGNDVRALLNRLHTSLCAELQDLYWDLGPPKWSQFTWRPTITRGEMHTDKGVPGRTGKDRIITAFVNVDTEPRKWKLGDGQEIDWPSGCFWAFQAEKVPHQVVYGRCCVQYNWVLMD